MADLLPCPFCGSDAEHYPDGEDKGYRIMCSGNRDPGHRCYYGCFADDDADAAEKRWNLRTPSSASHEQVEPGCDLGNNEKFVRKCPEKDEATIDHALRISPADPSKVEALAGDVRELSKWLNEEPNRPIDRAALARVFQYLALHPQPSAPKGESE